MRTNNKHNAVMLTGSIVLCLGAGLLGSIFTISSVTTWFPTLAKPWFSPPNWLFGPVWTVLYILMGISLYLVWLKGWRNKDVRVAIWVFLIHLTLNVAWSWLFFGLHSTLAGFIGIIFLWSMILALVIMFKRIRPAAAYLLIPYLAWVTFAGFLNFVLWQMN